MKAVDSDELRSEISVLRDNLSPENNVWDAGAWQMLMIFEVFIEDNEFETDDAISASAYENGWNAGYDRGIIEGCRI